MSDVATALLQLTGRTEPTADPALAAVKLARATIDALVLRLGQTIDAKVTAQLAGGLTQLTAGTETFVLKLETPLPVNTAVALRIAATPNGQPAVTVAVQPQPPAAQPAPPAPPPTQPLPAAPTPLPPSTSSPVSPSATIPLPVPGQTPIAPSPTATLPPQPAATPPLPSATPPQATIPQASTSQVAPPSAPAPQVTQAGSQVSVPPTAQPVAAQPAPLSLPSPPTAIPATTTATPPSPPTLAAPAPSPPTGSVSPTPAPVATSAIPTPPPVTPGATVQPGPSLLAAQTASTTPAAPAPLLTTPALAALPSQPIATNLAAPPSVLPPASAPAPAPAAQTAPAPVPPAAPQALPQSPAPSVATQPVPRPTPPATSPSLTQILTDPVQAAARQDTVLPLLARLASLSAPAASALPRPALEAIARILAGRLDLNRAPPDGRSIRDAVLRAGIITEPGARIPTDAKSALLQLRSALAAFVGSETEAVAPVTRRPPPPLKGEPVRAPSPQPAVPASEEPLETARQLLGHTDASLSRLKLLQLASNPPDAARLNTPAPAAEFRVEVPMQLGAETGILQLLVERDGKHKRTPAERGWRMRFALNFTVTGEVGAELALLGRTASIALWAAEPATADALEAMLPELAPALARHGLDLGAVRVRRGVPQPAARAPGQLLDSAR